ncbi:MAG: cysteine desulfurase NifS [Euryarchaeota archaeon]|nr:cysteine desulfurase NifS [Euryarchaeota archaeon]
MVDPKVVEAMRPFFSEHFGNPSSLHSFGREAANAIESSREIVGKSIGAKSKEIVFTAGGTESDNLAIQGAAFANREKGNHIVTSLIEHHAVLHTCQFLETQGFKVTYLPVDEHGIVSEEEVKTAVTKGTILVSVMTANNEIGTVQPIRAIGDIARDRGALFHTDAVQAATKTPIEVEKDNIDLLSISAHKLHGPKGVGGLYLRKDVRIRPLMYGGGHERGLRSSTENVSGIVGMGKAMEIAMASIDEDMERMRSLRERIISDILAAVPNSYLNGHRTKRLCNNAHFRFDFIEGESLVLHLDAKGIATSTGSACSTKSLDPSHVLLACGMKPEHARGSLRVSLSRMSTVEEVDYLLETLPDTVATLREISPVKSWD